MSTYAQCSINLVLHKVTGPVARFARQIAGHGYLVAAPSSYHEFTGPEPLAYDGPGTDVNVFLKYSYPSGVILRFDTLQQSRILFTLVYRYGNGPGLSRKNC